MGGALVLMGGEFRKKSLDGEGVPPHYGKPRKPLLKRVCWKRWNELMITLVHLASKYKNE